MRAHEIIKKVEEDASEWIEMSHEPATLVAGILANKIIKLMDYIEFLEAMLKHEKITR